MAPVAQDVPTGLANLLKKEFRWLVCKKDQMKIESKLKVCRFIGELVKFKMFEAAEALFCLRFAHSSARLQSIKYYGSQVGKYYWSRQSINPRQENIFTFRFSSNSIALISDP